MMWLWIAAGILLAMAVFALRTRARRPRALVALRSHFSRIARLRLVSTCPGLDGLLEEAELRMLFDWMLLQLYQRTGTRGFGELMQWASAEGDAELLALTSDVSREALERLPSSVLAAIDKCHGRNIAAVLIDQSLTEAGRRVGPELSRSPA